jgi:hypothetical protein
MAEVDYGYGDGAPEVDYGYGESAPETDYGYGDAAPGSAYGYGNSASEPDYGYGNAAPADYGYGDAAPDSNGYGYGDAEPAPEPTRRNAPKRRCSVTKYSLDVHAPLPEPQPAYGVSRCDTNSSTLTAASSIASAEGREEKMVIREKVVKKTMMSKLRKRLSIMG